MLCFRDCVSFMLLDVVCSEITDGVRYDGMYEFVNKFMYIHSVKCLTHVKGYCDLCARGCSETCCKVLCILCNVS